MTDATLGKKFPEWLEQLVTKGLAKDPAHRFSTLADMIDAIDSSSVADQTAISTQASAKRSWLPVAVATIAAIMAVAAVVHWLMGTSSSTRPVAHPSVSAATAPPAKSDSATNNTGAEEQNADDVAFAEMLKKSDKHMTKLEGVPTDIHDNSLDMLAQFPDLQTIVLNDCGNITGYGLYKLRKMKRLEALILKGTKCGDDSIGFVKSMPNVRFLEIADTALSDDDLRELQGSSIESLNLSNTAITNDGLKDMSRFKRLTELKLNGCKIGDDGVNALAGVKTLETLWLDKTNISDGIINFLVNTKSNWCLTYLSARNVRNPAFNGALLVEIVKKGAVPKLASLDLSGDKQFSEAEIAAFKANRPHCQVKHDKVSNFRTFYNDVLKEGQR